MEIFSCESCENLMLVDKVPEETFICSICGCINSVKDSYGKQDISVGELKITSGRLKANKSKLKLGTLSITPDLTEEEENAILVLQRAGWKLKFKMT